MIDAGHEQGMALRTYILIVLDPEADGITELGLVFQHLEKGGVYGSVGTYYHKNIRGNPEYQLMPESGE